MMPTLQYLTKVRPLEAPMGTVPSAPMLELYTLPLVSGQSVETTALAAVGREVAEGEVLLEEVLNVDDSIVVIVFVTGL